MQERAAAVVVCCSQGSGVCWRGDKGEKERVNGTKYELYSVDDFPQGDLRLFVDCLGLPWLPTVEDAVAAVVVTVMPLTVVVV